MTDNAMQLRLESKSDVRKFAVSITLFAVIGCVALQFLMLPEGLDREVLFRGMTISTILSLPISYFVGMQLWEVHALTVQLEHAVNHDNLTGLCTRTSFYHRLDAVNESPMVMIAIDVDHFKRINDEFGHQAGDAALKQFAATLLRNCREDDVVARFGGEEFVVLLHETDLDGGVLAAQRLCRKIREKRFVVNGDQMKITASFGVAEVESIDRIDDAIHRSDLAAYRAKREGRDRVCAFTPALDLTEPDTKAAE